MEFIYNFVYTNFELNSKYYVVMRYYKTEN